MQLHIITSDTALYSELSGIINEQFGDCRVTRLSSNKEILAAAERGFIELALIDTAFAEDDCISVTEIIRARAPFSGVIMLADDESMAVRSYEAHAQGYIIKPAAPDRIKAELCFFYEHFLIPDKNKKRVAVMTEGSFDILIDGKPLRFRRRKAKAVLAYLVSQRGRMVTTQELIKALWGEDCSTLSEQKLLSRNSNIRTLRAELERMFREAGLPDFLLKNWGEMAVNMDQIRFIEE